MHREKAGRWNDTTDLDDWFEPTGAVSAFVDGFRPRESQRAMANAIAGAIEGSDDLMVEAGTGTGKTFAYLLPVVLSGKRAIVSTGTRTLQDQLWGVDLPLIRQVTQTTARFALLKGRGNYLCPHRLDRHLQESGRRVTDDMRARMVEVRQWSSRTRTGDLGEIMDTESEAALAPLITSTADNCLGRGCAWIDECPVYRARARAAEADLVVVNHHLLFSDMAMDDEAVTPLLPDAEVVVLDEAHQVANVARQFFGYRLSSHQLLELVRDLDAEYRLLGSEDVHLGESVARFERAVRDLASDLSTTEGATCGAACVEAVDLAFGSLLSRLGSVRERSKGYQNCHKRALRFFDLFAMLTEPDVDADSGEFARWIDRTDNGFVLHLSPVSIAGEFGERVRNASQSWILTSATLSVAGGFDHAVDELGLAGIETIVYPSPFDFEHQVCAWIPPLGALPGTSDHTAELIDNCLPLLESCRGRTFMLFTTYRALREAAAILNARGSFNCLVQGTASRAGLLERFRQTERSILLATQSFWEGVDVRGAGLRLLVIDKLPFPSPEQPLTAARIRAIEALGGNGFTEHLLPEAIMRLRQGFGRLIREEEDRGVFILGDTRVRSRAYGGAVLGSLPSLRWVADGDEARICLEALG